MQLDTRGSSDHAIIVLQVGFRSPKPRNTPPIDPYIFRRHKFLHFLNAELINLPIDDPNPSSRSLKHKSNLRKAARRTREWIQDNEEATTFEDVKSLSSISRAVWTQNFRDAVALQEKTRNEA